MLVQHLWLLFLWILFCVLHSLLAARFLKRKLQRTMGDRFRYYRLAYTLFAFLSLAGVLIYQLSIENYRLYEPGPLLKILGGLLALAGGVVMAICIKKYFLSLSGIRSLFTESVAASLEITGIHRFVRHPLYLGTFAFIWGVWLLFPLLSLLIACSVITAYTLIGIRFEEQKLIDEFGDQYLQYRRKVPMLFPLLKNSRTLK